MEDHILLEVEHFPDDSAVINYHLFDLDYDYIAKVEAGDGGWMDELYPRNKWKPAVLLGRRLF
jgi:hypothetical protein